MDMKIQSLAFVLLMIMLFSSAVSGQDERKPNLLIGGVWQTAEDQAINQKYADVLNAEYVHTYYSLTKNPYAYDETTITGKLLADINTKEATAYDAAAKTADVWAVKQATPVQDNHYWAGVVPKVEKPATTEGTVYRNIRDPSGAIVAYASYDSNKLNGLTDERLNPSKDGVGKHYDTIYAHSGGARTAVTALLYQGVTADKLVLISPANGGEDDELYKQELQTLLDSKKVGEIVFYQSSDPKADAAFMNDLWQTRFEKSDFSGNFRIETVTNEQLLGKKETEGHIQMWYTVLNLELGRDPTSDEKDSCITANAKSWFEKGEAANDQGNYAESIEYYKKAIDICPQYAEAWLGKASALIDLGRYEEALQPCDKAIELDPQSALAWATKGMALNFLKRFDESLQACDKAIELDPQSTFAWNCKGVDLMRLQRWDEALIATRNAVEFNSDHIKRVWSNYGAALYYSKQYDEAVHAFEEENKINPEWAEAWQYKGRALEKCNRGDEAKIAFKRATELRAKQI
jgi:tetratricopeptide (TPR) repeat protein